MKRLSLVLFCCLLAVCTFGQGKKKKTSSSFNTRNKEADKFLEKQWWIGFKAGTNLSDAVVEKTYNVLLATNYTAAGKKYESFNKLGSQAALEITFYFKHASLSLQPTYRHASFVYTTRYEWIDSEDPNSHLELNYEQEQKVDHAVLPLLFKYDLTSTQLRPYLQAGLYYAFLVNANKSVKVTGTDYASGGVNTFENEPIIVGAKDLFAKNHWGLVGGAGVNYNIGNVRLNFDVMYAYGMSNITSTQNRFSSDRLSGVGDAMDDMKLNNLAVSVGCLFPMRFLGSGFKSLDR
jgi:outer membrane protein W